jgi:hypothetical protein
MSINIYWACNEKEWMLATAPEAVSKKFYAEKKYITGHAFAGVNECPAFNGALKNLYTMKSLYNYHFYVDPDKTWTDVKTQEFFEEHVLIREPKLRMFSFMNKYIFFTDSDSLDTTFYQFPYLEDNNITKRCMPIVGKFDIGQWYRNTEFAFYLKPDFNEFKIEKDEVYGYVQFHTDQKINFIQYAMTDKLRGYAKDGFALNPNMGVMEKYYMHFKLKKLILKEIKENLI